MGALSAVGDDMERTNKSQKTLFFSKELLKEYEELCAKLGFRMSSRMEQYMKRDVVLLRSYAKKIEV